MNIMLFAAGNIGHEVVQFFGNHQEPVSCLVLDSKDGFGLNSDIIQALDVDSQKIIFSDDLYKAETISKIKEMRIDLGILAWWPYIIKEPILSVASIGILNFHPSYLPFNRGKHYNFWTIVEDTPFGVTIHFVDKGVDTGDIAFQARIDKSWEDTAETLYKKAQAEIVRLFIENFPRIKTGNIPRIPQDINDGSYHKASELDSASYFDINKSYEARDLLNLLRARTFLPYPAAWFADKDEEYEVRIKITKRSRK